MCYIRTRYYRDCPHKIHERVIVGRNTCPSLKRNPLQCKCPGIVKPAAREKETTRKSIENLLNTHPRNMIIQDHDHDDDKFYGVHCDKTQSFDKGGPDGKILQLPKLKGYCGSCEAERAEKAQKKGGWFGLGR